MALNCGMPIIDTMTRCDYYYVVDENGRVWTYTANENAAINIARKLDHTHGLTFRVYDCTDHIYTSCN